MADAERLRQRWALLTAINGAAKDLVHPLDVRPVGQGLGFTEALTEALVGDLERDGYVVLKSWGWTLVTITAEGQRAVERGIGFEP